MNLNKFYYFLVVLLCSISFTACSDDDDKQTVPHIELTASMSAFSEGSCLSMKKTAFCQYLKKVPSQAASHWATLPEQIWMALL